MARGGEIALCGDFAVACGGQERLEGTARDPPGGFTEELVGVKAPLFNEADKWANVFVSQRAQRFNAADRVAQREWEQILVTMPEHRVIELGPAVFDAKARAQAIAEAHDRRVEDALARLGTILDQRKQSVAGLVLQPGEPIDGGDANAEDPRSAPHVYILLLGEGENQLICVEMHHADFLQIPFCWAMRLRAHQTLLASVVVRMVRPVCWSGDRAEARKL